MAGANGVNGARVALQLVVAQGHRRALVLVITRRLQMEEMIATGPILNPNLAVLPPVQLTDNALLLLTAMHILLLPADSFA